MENQNTCINQLPTFTAVLLVNGQPYLAGEVLPIFQRQQEPFYLVLTQYPLKYECIKPLQMKSFSPHTPGCQL